MKKNISFFLVLTFTISLSQNCKVFKDEIYSLKHNSFLYKDINFKDSVLIKNENFPWNHTIKLKILNNEDIYRDKDYTLVKAYYHKSSVKIGESFDDTPEEFEYLKNKEWYVKKSNLLPEYYIENNDSYEYDYFTKFQAFVNDNNGCSTNFEKLKMNYLMLASLKFDNEEYENALKYLNKASLIKINLSKKNHYKLIIDKDYQAKSKESFLIGKTKYHLSDLYGARVAFKEVLEICNKNKDCNSDVGWYITLEESFQLDEVYSYLGFIESQLKNKESAKTYLKKSISLNEFNDESLRLLGLILLDEGKIEEGCLKLSSSSQYGNKTSLNLLQKHCQ